MERKKKYLILGIIILLALGGVTVAYLTWSSNKINIGLNSDCFTIDYTKGGDINNASVKLMNESDLIDSNNKFTIKEGIALTYANIGIKSTCGIEGYGSLYLNITSLSDAFTTGNSVGALKYAILKNTSTSTVSVTDLLNQSFDIEKTGSITSTGTKKILTKQLSNTEINKYIIVIYIDKTLAGNDVIGSTFSGKISAEADQGSFSNYTLQKLHSLNSTIVLDTTKTPDFSTVSGNSGVKHNDNDGTSVPNQGDGTKGIYSSVDDFGTTYYFRGDVDNNYLSFAGQMWRIVRINGDGSIRIATQNSIGTSKYNTSYNDNAYVGYMYGTPGSSSYAETHKNTNDSTIKTYLDNWYNNNLSSYADYIEDTIYCNDRSISSITGSINGSTFTNEGYATDNTLYMSAERNNTNHSPSLKCSNVNDRFTVSTSKGNGALTVPIGLLTTDEVAFAGAYAYDLMSGAYITNDSYYLYLSNNFWWIMTPNNFEDGIASVDYVYRDGSVGGGIVDDHNIAVRPVVSLNADAITGGDGTMNNPFTVG